MASLSICMIVKNEEKVLKRCLNCISRLADELIIIDTGSTDKTREIAQNSIAKVYDFKWVQDFSKARNYSFSKATKDYIMWLDADDTIDYGDVDKLIDLKINLSADAIMLPYNVGFDDEGNLTLSYYRERILKRECNFIWKEPVHEYIETYGNIEYVDIPIIHYPVKNRSVNKVDRNLKIYQNMENNGIYFSPRATYYYARELKEHMFYNKAIDTYYTFLESGNGWIEDKINACIGLSEIYISQNKEEDALTSLFYTFVYDIPRTEPCCRIANIFFNKKDYEKAIYWYNFALNAKIPNSGFIYEDYNGFIPNIQLCVCYDKIGNRQKAIEYNEKAGKIKPNNKAYLFNCDYFKSL